MHRPCTHAEENQAHKDHWTSPHCSTTRDPTEDENKAFSCTRRPPFQKSTSRA